MIIAERNWRERRHKVGYGSISLELCQTTSSPTGTGDHEGFAIVTALGAST